MSILLLFMGTFAIFKVLLREHHSELFDLSDIILYRAAFALSKHVGFIFFLLVVSCQILERDGVM